MNVLVAEFGCRVLRLSKTTYRRQMHLSLLILMEYEMIRKVIVRIMMFGVWCLVFGNDVP